MSVQEQVVGQLSEVEQDASPKAVTADKTLPAPVEDDAKDGVREAASSANLAFSSKPARWRPPEWVGRWSVRIAALIIALGIWHYLTEADWNYIMNFENVPEPAIVFGNLIDHLQTSDFYIHVLVSMKRILIGYGFAVVLGILIGLLMGRSKFAEDFFIPYIEVLRPIPAVAWIPLAILMWPTEESSIIFITFLGALFPIILNTVHGAEQTPQVLVRAAQSLGASRIEIFWHVVIPAALPSISAGLAIGMGVSWFSLLAGEIISGQYGIGYFTWDAYSLIQYPDIIVGMLAIGGLGTASTYLVKLATKPFLRWQTLEKDR